MMLNENGYEELKELATFCLIVRIPYSEAKEMTLQERAAFIEAYNDIQKEQEKAMKKK